MSVLLSETRSRWQPCRFTTTVICELYQSRATFCFDCCLAFLISFKKTILDLRRVTKYHLPLFSLCSWDFSVKVNRKIYFTTSQRHYTGLEMFAMIKCNSFLFLLVIKSLALSCLSEAIHVVRNDYYCSHIISQDTRWWYETTWLS